MIKFVKECFCFSRGERIGTILLAGIMVVVFVFPYLNNLIDKSYVYQPDHILISEINSFYGLHIRDSIYSADQNSYRNHPVKPLLRTFRGDNITDLKPELATAHLPVPVPGFKSDITQQQPANDIMHHYYVSTDSWDKKDNPNRIDINTADTTELMKIRGIGPVFSGRIVRYRNILGGYYCVSQLQEVYGMDEERYRETEPFVFAGTTSIVMLRLLTDEFKVLLRHPYLNYEQVSDIFRLRRSGGLTSCEDLLQSPEISDKDITRLMPYVAFD